MQTTQIMVVKAMTWTHPSLTRRQVLGPRLVWLGCPVQALEVEEVASTYNTSTSKALVDIGRAPSAFPTRENTHSI